MWTMESKYRNVFAEAGNSILIDHSMRFYLPQLRHPPPGLSRGLRRIVSARALQPRLWVLRTEFHARKLICFATTRPLPQRRLALTQVLLQERHHRWELIHIYIASRQHVTIIGKGRI